MMKLILALNLAEVVSFEITMHNGGLFVFFPPKPKEGS